MFSYQWEQPWLPCSETLLTWDDSFHALMLGDRLRMAHYRSAIMEVVQPGDVVIDLGTGTGILSQWALQAGAARVYGIELNGAVLEQACARIAAAGLAERFVPINQLSFDATLPQPADLLVSEIMGNMADNEDMLPILADASQRLLKPGGHSLPIAVSSWLAPVAATQAHARVGRGDVATLGPAYDLAALYRERRIASPFNLYYDCILPQQCRLAPAQRLHQFEHPWQQPACYVRRFVFELTGRSCLTGFMVFFRAQLSDGVTLDISGDDIEAGETSDSWKHAYLPIENALPTEPGDLLQLDFERSYAEDGSRFQQIYHWRGTLTRGARRVATFDQCMDERLVGASPALDTPEPQTWL
jgi:protein arginine N-methyltransferase 1